MRKEWEYVISLSLPSCSQRLLSRPSCNLCHSIESFNSFNFKTFPVFLQIAVTLCLFLKQTLVWPLSVSRTYRIYICSILKVDIIVTFVSFQSRHNCAFCLYPMARPFVHQHLRYDNLIAIVIVHVTFVLCKTYLV